MTESFFLTKSTVEPGTLIPAGRVPAIEQHEALRDFLIGRGLKNAADLFAEPVLSRGNDAAPATVSWYVTRSGAGRPAADLPPDARAAVEAAARQALAGLGPALADPEHGPLLGAAMHVASDHSLWSVDGQPFLIGWGMAPESATASQAARDAHFAQTLGRIAPIASAPPIDAEEWHAMHGGVAAPENGGDAPRPGGAAAAGTVVAGAAAPGAAPAAQRGAAAGPGAMGGPGIAPAGGDGGGDGDHGGESPAMGGAREPAHWRWRWIAPIGLFVLFGAALIWLLLPGSLLYPPRQAVSVIDDEGVVAAAREANCGLETRIAELRAAMEGAVCTPRGELVLPSGLTPDGRAPLPPGPISPGPIPTEPGATPMAPSGTDAGTQRSEAQPADALGGAAPADPRPAAPPPPSRLVAPPPAGGDPVALLERLEESTALILAVGADGVSQGSGFFVAPDLVVTNHHVVTLDEPGAPRLFVANEGLGVLTPAELVASDGPLEGTGRDFALLRVPGATMPEYPLVRPQASLKLQQVIAAGYPGFVMETDQSYQALLRGDVEAIPGLVVTDGIVNAEQLIGPRTGVMIHTAEISSGNSGGPLVDACGRVVGVNTFVRNNASSLNSLNFALTSTDLLDFLAEHGAAPAAVTEACQPQVSAPMPPRVAEAIPTEAEGAGAGAGAERAGGAEGAGGAAER